MLDSAAEQPTPARLNWQVALALAIATCLFTFVSRWTSPLGGDSISMVWPACGIMLAAWIRFGLPGALASAAGLLAWAALSFPNTPTLWAVAVGTDLVASGMGAWFMQRMMASLQKRAGRRAVTRTEWLYALYTAAIAVAALFAGLLVSIVRPLSGLYSEFSWLEVAGGYWIVQSLGYVLFAPTTLALLSAAGFNDPRLPFSTHRLSWRHSIDWVTLILALLLAAALMAMVWAGLSGYARVLVVWAFALMAWTAVRKPALPTYLSLIVIVMSILPARTLTVLEEDHALLKFFEIFEGILMAAIAVFITQIIQAVVHENKAQQNQLQHRLRTDMQSGLLNEHGLREVLATNQGNAAAAIVLLHFPALPQLVASLGSERAQRVQSALAERVALFGEHATRLDSTSYCCVWADAQDDALPKRLEQIQEQLAGLRIRAGEGTVRLQCQTGVLLLDAGADAAGDAFAQAVLAAVWQVEGTLQTPRQTPLILRMSDQLNLAARERNERVLLIRQALEQGSVEVFAQAIESNINPPTADSPLMFEALARLRLDDGTLLAPGAFLAIAEQNGLIRQLDRTMIQKTFTWFAARPDALQRLARCSINLSGQSISAEGIASEIRSLANSLNLPVGKFSFEITESEAIQDANLAVRAVADLRAAGFGTAIDDFGTGLATFSYLKRFEVDLIKIDGAFIRLLDDGVRRAEVDREIVRSIVRVAQSLGVKTAAEFVETQAIREHVTALGVHYSQGYAIAKPIPIAEFFK
jgi:EAL domain-containing protein (putative c-di-GMP-specific phosphodiesterase class I)/GGDEF domain-containing protein